MICAFTNMCTNNFFSACKVLRQCTAFFSSIGLATSFQTLEMGGCFQFHMELWFTDRCFEPYSGICGFVTLQLTAGSPKLLSGLAPRICTIFFLFTTVYNPHSGFVKVAHPCERRGFFWKHVILIRSMTRKYGDQHHQRHCFEERDTTEVPPRY